MTDEGAVNRTDEELEAYLLGRIPDDAIESFENAVFDDDAAFEQLEIAEARLMERYADGDMDADTRARFERRLLQSPEGRARLATIQALDAKGRAAKVPWYRKRRTFAGVFGAAITAAAVLLIVIAPGPTTVTLAPNALRASAPPPTVAVDTKLHLRLELEDPSSPPSTPRVRVMASNLDQTWPARVVEGYVEVDLDVDVPAGTIEIHLLDGDVLIATYALSVTAP